MSAGSGGELLKTIRPPKMPKPERVYQIACNNKECEALLQMGHGELKIIHNQKDMETLAQFICPHCNKTSSVEQRLLKTYLIPTGPIPRHMIKD